VAEVAAVVDAGRVDAAVAGRVAAVAEGVEEVAPAVEVAAAVVVAVAEDGEAGEVEVEVAGGGW